MALGLWLAGCGGAPAVAPSVPPTAAATPSAAPKVSKPLTNLVPAVVAVTSDSVNYEFTDPERKARLDQGVADLQAWIEQRGQELKVAGLFAGVVVDDELVATGSYGYQDTRHGTKVDQRSVFRVGSITKPMTAMAVLELRDAGKLHLDAAVADYLPEIARVKTLTHDSPPLTLRHLLTHTSGLPREAATLDATGTSENALLGALSGLALEFEPGSRYQYSNLGFTLLGLVIARVSGMPYRQYMQQHVFDPLGLGSASWDRARVDAEHLALPHRLEADAFVVDPNEEVFGAREPSGGLYISGEDFGRFLAWQLAAEPPGQDTPELGVLRGSRREAQQIGRLTGFSVGPARAETTWVANAEASAVGLSWHGYSNCDFDHVVFHNGLVHTYSTDAAFLPRFGVGVFVFANSSPADVGRLRRELLAKLKQTGALVPREKRPLQAARLELALARLLDVYNTWDETKYQAMLSEGHKKNITQERERVELAEYRELHGACASARMLQYTNQNVARYVLSCERSRLEMALYINAETGLIDGFVGYSTGVKPPQKVVSAAKKTLEILNFWNERAFEQLMTERPDATAGGRALSQQLRSVAPCSLGELLERDGNRWHRFRATCKRGPARVLALHLDEADPSRVDGMALTPVSGGSCAEK